MKQRQAFILIGLLVLACFAALLSLTVGSTAIPLHDLLCGLVGKEGYETPRLILTAIRLPRLLGAILAGVGLSLSGTLLQSTLSNDLASPNTVGVNAGAGLFVILCLALFPTLSTALPLFAFCGAFLTALLILGLARRMGSSKATVILAGIACTTLFQSLISLISIADTDILISYNAFSVGSLSLLRMEQLILPTFLIALCLLLAIALSARIEALSLGDAIASSLGIRVGALRASALLIASLSAAAVVSFAGLLGFVGLIVPHLSKKLVGGSLRLRIITAPMIGAIVVILSDLLGRVLFYPSEIPVGVIMSLLGAPFFLFLLLSRRSKYHA